MFPTDDSEETLRANNRLWYDTVFGKVADAVIFGPTPIEDDPILKGIDAFYAMHEEAEASFEIDEGEVHTCGPNCPCPAGRMRRMRGMDAENMRRMELESGE